MKLLIVVQSVTVWKSVSVPLLCKIRARINKEPEFASNRYKSPSKYNLKPIDNIIDSSKSRKIVIFHEPSSDVEMDEEDMNRLSLYSFENNRFIVKPKHPDYWGYDESGYLPSGKENQYLIESANIYKKAKSNRKGWEIYKPNIFKLPKKLM